MTDQLECELQSIRRRGLFVPQRALDACTGIAEYESKARTCEALGCFEWHRWCGPCMADERRASADDLTEVRSLAEVAS